MWLRKHFIYPKGEKVMNNGKGMSVAALVLGIVSAVCGWWGLALGIISLICGIVGIVLAVKGKKAATEAGAPTGLATAGLVLSIIGTCLSVIGVVACGLCYAGMASASNALSGSDLNDLANALNGLN